jgi:arylsulfatase A-like enzyme
MMTRRQLLRAGAVAPLVSRAAARPLNIVFILTDDLGAWALHCYGCQDSHTPNLDRLAAEGMRFTRAFACTPVCSASRATWLTGRLPSHDGVQDWLLTDDCVGPTARDFLAGQPTLSETLKSHGYTCGLSGKWHLGNDDRAHAGFDYWASIPGGGGSFKDASFFKNGARTATKGFKDDFVADYGMEFIDANKDRPFFLYLAFFSPHIPYDFQPDADRQWHAGAKFPCFSDEPIHPWHTRTLEDHPFPTLKDFHNPESKRAYASLVTAMDRNVGRVVERLEKLGLRDNTLIVFSADQGHCCGHHGIWGKGNSTWPFNMYDTSLRVPLIWNLPGRIKAGQSADPLVSAYDFFPTLLDYAGLEAPRDARRVGHSYAGFLRGHKPSWRNELYFEYEYVRGVRTPNLKYIERTTEWPSELYDLEADSGERTNVLDDPRHRRQLSALRTRLHGFFDAAGAPPLDQWRTTTKQHLPEYGK